MKERLIIKNSKVIDFLDMRNKEVIERAVKKTEKFFGKKVDFEVVLLETREEIDLIYSKYFGKDFKTEDWVVGGIFDDKTVYIFREDVYGKVSCHPQESFFPTLVHEITHIFTSKLFKFHLPMWLYEGLSYFVAGQDKEVDLKEKEDLMKAHTEIEWRLTNPYLTSGKFVRYLFDKYGKKKLFKLFKELDEDETKSSFEEKFQKILNEKYKLIWEEWYTDPDIL